MKQILALFLVIVLLLTTFAACGKKKSGGKTDDDAEYIALYAPVLKKYKQALDEGWQREKYLENSLTPQFANLDKTAASFAFLDLNGDKTPELFIGRADQSATVYDLYTVTGSDDIKQLATPTTEETYTLTDDNRLVKEDDSYDALDVTTFYALEDASLTPTDSYIHDAEKIIDGMDEWYHATGTLPESETEFYADALDVITEEDYLANTAYELGKLVLRAIADLVLPTTDAPVQDSTNTSASVGDYITFGSYEQDNDLSNGPEPIEWLVLDTDGNKALVISKYGLDCQPYGTENSETWEWKTCTLRKWLSDTFRSNAFSETEQRIILNTEHTQHISGTTENEKIQDQVFLLDDMETELYFSSPDASMCVPTEYAVVQGVQTDDAYHADGKATCTWWLRSQGRAFGCANTVNSSGYTDSYGSGVGSEGIAVRPAMWIAAGGSTSSAGELTTTAPTQDSTNTSVSVGDYITFGHYEQDNDESNGPEPIEWLVLDTDGDKALVISKYGLDCQQYYTEGTDVTWETCTLRTWLNNDFYNSTFSSSERNQIVTTTLKNDDNPEYGTEGGSNTQDKVFLLSIDEANKYFASDEARKCVPTVYAMKQGAFIGRTIPPAGDTATCWWWLRSPGYHFYDAVYVNLDGYVYSFGRDVIFGSVTVRPAMWITVGA